MDFISVLDTIRGAVKDHWQRQPSGALIIDANAAPAAASTDSPTNHTAPAAPATNSAHSTDTAPAAAYDDDPLAQIETTVTAPTPRGRATKARFKSRYERQGQQTYMYKPTQVRLRNAPTCVSGDDADDYIEVWAMVEQHGELWVDVDSLGWLVAYAVDEHARLGVPHPPKRMKSSHLPNCSDHCPGLWHGYDHRMARWQFEFVEQVDGLDPADMNLRRYFHISQLTDRIWTDYGPDTDPPLAEAPLHDKRSVARSFVYAWANAIIEGNEQSLLQQFGVQQAVSDTAPAATAAPMDHALSDADSDRGDGDAFIGGVDDAADSDDDDSAG